MEGDYSNREIDRMFQEIQQSLNRIEVQTTKHNGRLSKIERVLLVVGTVTIVLLVVNGSSLINLVSTIIK